MEDLTYNQKLIDDTLNKIKNKTNNLEHYFLKIQKSYDVAIFGKIRISPKKVTSVAHLSNDTNEY